MRRRRSRRRGLRVDSLEGRAVCWPRALGRVRRGGALRTPSGPRGSSGKGVSPGAAGCRPGRSTPTSPARTPSASSTAVDPPTGAPRLQHLESMDRSIAPARLLSTSAHGRLAAHPSGAGRARGGGRRIIRAPTRWRGDQRQPFAYLPAAALRADNRFRLRSEEHQLLEPRPAGSAVVFVDRHPRLLGNRDRSKS